MTRILVAGAGYLGQAFANIRANDEVTLARRTPKPALFPGMKTIACDFSEPSSLRDLPEVDLVYYAVAADDSSDRAYEKAYFESLKNLVDHYKVRAVKPTFFYSSSTSVYKENDGDICDENSPLVDSGPSRFMVRGEQTLLESGLKATILRYGGIYGPERNSFVQRIKDRKEALTPGVTRYMNRVHQADAVSIVSHLYEKGLSGVFNAVDAEPSIRDEVILWCMKELGLSRKAYPEGDVPLRGHRRVLSDKLKATGYVYHYPSYREGYQLVIRALGSE